MAHTYIHTYIFRNDYNKAFKIKDKEYYCYSKGKLKHMYFDADDYKVIGETLKTPKNAEGIIGTLDMENNITLDVFSSGTHPKHAYTCEGYLAVGRDSYIALMKKRFSFR